MNWEDNRCGQMIEEMKEAIKHVEHRKQELSIVCVCVCDIRLNPYLRWAVECWMQPDEIIVS